MALKTLPAGLHLTHKPVGVTSFSCVRERAPAEGGRWRLCHGGTLDPFAHGLLILLVGPATRLMDRLHAVPKVYETEVVWGAETDNGDPTGTPVAHGDPGVLTPELLDRALAPFFGWQPQVPPATSAKKIGGEPAYRRVHRGETVVLPPSQVYLHEARWLAHDLPRRSQLRLVVRGGFYVRALARDLGRALGCRAHLSRLHRTAIGPFEDPGPGREVGLRGPDVLPWLPRRYVTVEERRRLKAREPLPRGAIEEPVWPLPAGFPPDAEGAILAVREDVLFATLRADGDSLRSETWLAPGI